MDDQSERKFSTKYSFHTRSGDFAILRYRRRIYQRYLLKKQELIAKLPAPLRMTRFSAHQKFLIFSFIGVYATIKYLQWLTSSYYIVADHLIKHMAIFIDYKRRQIINLRRIMNKGTNIFTYGTLMYPQVMYNLVKKQDYKTEHGVLKHYARRHVKGASYPGIMKKQNEKVKGILYFDVNQQDVKILHRFQGTQYIPHQVQIQLKNGNKVNALVYLYANPQNLSNEEWDIKNFQQNHKSTFAYGHTAPKEK